MNTRNVNKPGIRIDIAADLADMWGGQTEFEVAVYLNDENGELIEILGAGHTVAEAVAEARDTLRTWREEDEQKRGCGPGGDCSSCNPERS